MGGRVILSLALKDFVGCSGCIEKGYILSVWARCKCLMPAAEFYETIDC
jgi:hypothetical protein